MDTSLQIYNYKWAFYNIAQFSTLSVRRFASASSPKVGGIIGSLCTFACGKIRKAGFRTAKTAWGRAGKAQPWGFRHFDILVYDIHIFYPPFPPTIIPPPIFVKVYFLWNSSLHFICCQQIPAFFDELSTSPALNLLSRVK